MNAPYKKAGTQIDACLYESSDAVEADLGDRPLKCVQCSRVITTEQALVSVNGAVEHQFQNPAGVSYRIMCFREARGCRVHGTPTGEYTWFPGCKWSFALCASCGDLLGWHYTGAKRFFGLIRAKLVQAPPAD